MVLFQIMLLLPSTLPVTGLLGSWTSLGPRASHPVHRSRIPAARRSFQGGVGVRGLGRGRTPPTGYALKNIRALIGLPATRRRLASPRVASSLGLAGPDASSSGSISSSSEALVGDLLKLFQGEFDNYDQVIQDRKAGMGPGPGGGHEHIHCSLKLLDRAQVPDQVAGGGRMISGTGRQEGIAGGGSAGGQPLAVVAAKYYFNGDSNVVFRYRLYSFHAYPPNARGARGDAVMRLWRLLPPVEARLRAAGYDLASFEWCPRRQQQQQQQQQGQPGGGEAAELGEGGGGEGGAPEACDGEVDDVAEYIRGCEIYWSRAGDVHVRSSSASDTAGRLRSDVGTAEAGDGSGSSGKSSSNSSRSSGGKSSGAWSAPAQQAAAAEAPTPAPAPALPSGASFVGLMGEDDRGTWIESQNVAGLRILVKDDLRVWPDQLWVNDRGYDREGSFVYGNQRGVPYKMRRVVPGGPLAWTLGERHRTEEAYAEKMSAIGVTPGQRFGPPPPAAAEAPAT